MLQLNKVLATLRRGLSASRFKTPLGFLTPVGSLLNAYKDDHPAYSFQFMNVYLDSSLLTQTFFSSYIKDDSSLRIFKQAHQIAHFLKKNDLFDNDNFNDILAHSYSLELLIVLNHLCRAGLLNQENLKTMLRLKNIPRLNQAFIYMRDASLLTQENVNQLIKLEHIELFIDALYYLSQAKCLHQINFSIGVGIKQLGGLTQSLAYLKDACILNEENFKRIAVIDNLDQFAAALSSLHKAHKLTADNFRALVLGAAHPDNVVDALIYLECMFVINKAIRESIALHSQPKALAEAYVILSRAQLNYHHALGGSYLYGPGVLNRLVKRLADIHPDVKLVSINPSIPLLKLFDVVQEEARLYMAAFTNPLTSEDYCKIITILHHLQKDGRLSIIWPHIKETVEARMFEAFASLYINKKNPQFNMLIEAGEHVKWLPSFEEQLQRSEGYKQFCMNIVKYPGFFSVNTRPKEEDDQYKPMPVH